MKNRWRERPVTYASAAAFVLVLAVIVVQLVQGRPDSTTLVLVGIGTALLFGVFAPDSAGALVERMTNFKVVGVVEVGLDTAVLAKGVTPPGDEGDGVIVERRGQNLEAVVEKLKEKMRTVNKITNLEKRVGKKSDYPAIVYALAVDRLLDEEEARFVLDLVCGHDLGVKELPYRARQEFLDAAWSFASRFSFVVWDRYVRREMERDGWLVADFKQEPGHRPDFLAYRDGRWALVSARVGRRKGAEKGVARYPLTRERLEESDLGVPLEGRCIIVPGGERIATVVGKKGQGENSNVKVLRLSNLLEHPNKISSSDESNDDAERSPTRT